MTRREFTFWLCAGLVVVLLMFGYSHVSDRGYQHMKSPVSLPVDK